MGSPVEQLATAAVTGHVLIFTETGAGGFTHTDAIANGTPKIKAALEAAGLTVDVKHTADNFVFSDASLAPYDALVMFQTSGDPWTEPGEKEALERFQESGKGIAAIHNATDMRGNFAWWDNLVGSLMPGHAATNPPAGLPGEIIIEDKHHPSTRHLDGTRWARSDEWYNFSTNVRGTAHVLLAMDESTYAAGGNAMGYDHPISWCKPYDGGRAWVTALGHFGVHYDEPKLIQHIVGGVKYAAGLEAGDCGGTINSNFEKVTLDSNTSAPFALDVAPDGRVFFTELVRGQVRVYDPATQNVTTALTLDVYSGGEDGLLGIALDPDFATNRYVYLYWAPQSNDNNNPANWKSRVSRFTVGDNGLISPASEKLIIEFPATRGQDEPGHTGGALDFDNDGNLLIGIGDDVNPHSEPSGGYAPLSERTNDTRLHDARATSANTNDLRGKLLRITPSRTDAAGYTVPEGNLFPEVQDTADKTRPEIYAMGFRNPFRFSVDPKTGWIGLADYAPDSGTNAPDTRGPAGIVEYNLIKQPGNYGWPLCIGPNNGQVQGGPAGLTGRYRDVEYNNDGTATVGGFFDCANPVNDSRYNNGLTNLPPAQAPVMYYGYGSTSTVPAVIPGGGGLAPMGGPFYDYDPDLQSDVKFPASFDGKPFFYEWSKNRIYSMMLNEDGTKLEKIYRFLPTESFLSPQDMKFGPDGALYTLEWGGGFGRDNPNSGIYRLDYINGSRSPVARGTATPDNGATPLTVMFDGTGSTDPEGGLLSYAWDFDGNGTTDATTATPSHEYTTPGAYTVRLTVTDPAGKSGTVTIPVTVGNSRPVVKFNGPVDGGFIDWGDEVSWDVSVTDAEGGVNAENLIVQPALGHDEHPHPTTVQNGPTGSVVTDLGGGHSEDMNVFFILDARYTDGGNAGVPALTGTDTVILQPKYKQAEHADMSSGVDVAPISGDLQGGGDAGLVGLNAGDWAAFTPVNFTGIDSLTFRVAAQQTGGGIELRKNGPTGELLGTAAVPNTNGNARWQDVEIDLPASTETMDLYVVATGNANFRINFWEANGKGLSATTRPEVEITSPTEMQALEPGTSTFTAEATDAENEITGVEFYVDGVSIGTDTTAPYSIEWTEDQEDYYVVHAVATSDAGKTGTSRKVRFTVGEFGVRPPWTTVSFTTPDATFDQLGTNFKVTAAGADVWQATNQYGAVYLPGGTPEHFEAIVKVASFDGTHGSSKAGIMVRNDIGQQNGSPGYMVFSEKGNGETEFMHDAGGNGQLNNTGEPVATGCGTGTQPNWLKVQKKNKVFTVWCSRDGETWTQVGVPTLIPSAADVQDIGLFVNSHITGTPATAEFTNWSLTEIDGGPGEEPEDPAPACAPLKSDEFDGTAVNAARWTTVRGTPTVGGGAVTLPITNGDIDGANTGAISYLGQPAPAGSWTATTKVTLEQDNEWQYAGLLLHVDDDNYTKVAFTKHSNDSRFFEFWSETGGSRTGHGNNVTVPAATGNTVYVRLTSNGTNLTASYSLDGTSFTDIGTGPLKTGAKIGPVAAGDVDAQNKTAAFDWFRITPDEPPADPAFDDEFEGDKLDGCRWDKIRGWKSSNLEVADGKLAITTFDADISGANNGPIQNLILQTPPEGDWTVETKMTAPLKDNWQLAGFMLHADDDHYVKYDIVADNAPGEAPVRRVELRYENGGGLTGPTGVGADEPPPASPTDTWYLRLTKTGNTYTGAISTDGQTWHQTPGSVTVALTNPGLGLMAIGPDQSAGPIDVTFDYIRLVEEEPPNTAPAITSATATPSTGEAPLPVQFSAQATDADGDALSYSWDFGNGGTTEDAATKDATFTYTTPGTYTAKVTVSDGEDTDSETVTVTVQEPQEPGTPTVEAFADPTSGTAPLEVFLSATGLDPDGGELDYRWTFSDGGTALGESLERTYTAAGTYTATVEVTDDEGDKATDSVTITVTEPANAAPVIREAEATPTSGTAPLEVWFHAVADDPEGKPLTYRWEFGDAPGSMVGDEAEHTYYGAGTYTAKLTVTDQGGKTATKEFTITVADPPGNRAPSVEAAAVPPSGQVPLSVLLTANGRDPDGDALTYAWDFDDGTTGKGRRVRHTYTQVGTYEATVTASDGKGGTATATVEIVVGNPPANQAPTVEIAADPAGGTAPLKVNFSAAGLDPDGDALSYVWSFGDGGAAGGPKVTHTFAQAGSYTVTVTVKDAHGNTGTKSLTVVVTAPQRGAGAPVAPQGAAGSALEAVAPPSIAAFAKRGLKVTLRCATGGSGKLSVRVSKRVAKRLGVSRRALASGKVTCVAGKSVQYRVKPTKAVRKALRARSPKALRLTLRLALPSGNAVQRKLTVRR